MADPERVDLLATAEVVSPTVRDILRHLCGGGPNDTCRTYGAVVEWCEGRGDCCYAVVCPGCSIQFLVDEEELDELQRWTDTDGNALVCGIRWD